MEKRTSFFFPTKKVDIETEPFPFPRRGKPIRNSYKRLTQSTKDSLLKTPNKSMDYFDFQLTDHVKSQCVYYNDDYIINQMDPLTISEDTYRKIPLKLRIELCESSFTIVNLENNESIGYYYQEYLISILECLETNTISIELYTVMQNIGCAFLHNGKIACSVADYRKDPPYERIHILTASTEIMLEALAAEKGHQSNEIRIQTESDALLKAHPAICTDPSPDLARVQSTLDWRDKFWRRKNRDGPPKLKQNKQETAKVRTKFPVEDRKPRMEYTDSLQRLCASIGRRQN